MNAVKTQTPGSAQRCDLPWDLGDQGFLKFPVVRGVQFPLVVLTCPSSLCGLFCLGGQDYQVYLDLQIALCPLWCLGLPGLHENEFKPRDGQILWTRTAKDNPFQRERGSWRRPNRGEGGVQPEHFSSPSPYHINNHTLTFTHKEQLLMNLSRCSSC